MPGPRRSSQMVAVLLSVLTVTGSGAAEQRPPPASSFRLERFTSARPPFVLFRPSGWSVTPAQEDGGLRITVADREGVSGVEVAYRPNPRRLDSPGLLAETILDLRRRHPDLAVDEARACRDGASCATVTLRYTRRGVAVRGRLFVHAGPQLSVVRSYQGRAERFQAERPMLLDVLTNIQVGGAGGGATPVPLVPRRAPDGSLTVALPSSWEFQAGQGKAVAVSPGGGSGFMFTAFQVHPPGLGLPQPGVIFSTWQPPEQFIQVIWRQFGNREVKVLGTRPDAETAAACPQSINRACDAADILLSWVSPQGAACTGSFKLLDARPGITGQWFSIVAGIWGPSDALDEQLPTLEAVAASFAIQDRYARSYIQQGTARLKALQAQTSRSIQGLYQSIADSQRDYERRAEAKAGSDARWDDYRRGNSYWISDLEGGKVYQTDPWGTRDTTTGDRFEGGGYRYLHFEGENPNHPSENMREISSHELQQLLGRARP
jgi:hypothetical protein